MALARKEAGWRGSNGFGFRTTNKASDEGFRVQGLGFRAQEALSVPPRPSSATSAEAKEVLIP